MRCCSRSVFGLGLRRPSTDRPRGTQDKSKRPRYPRAHHLRDPRQEQQQGTLGHTTQREQERDHPSYPPGQVTQQMGDLRYLEPYRLPLRQPEQHEAAVAAEHPLPAGPTESCGSSHHGWWESERPRASSRVGTLGRLTPRGGQSTTISAVRRRRSCGNR